MKLHYLFISLLLFNSLTACSDDDNKPGTPPVPPDMSGFAKGADVSWITQMEHPRPGNGMYAFITRPRHEHRPSAGMGRSGRRLV